MSVPKLLSGPRPCITLFGDSITEQSFQENGWGGRLANMYCRHADVVLRGFSGYNSRWALLHLKQMMKEKAWRTPALVTIFFGANDAALEKASTQHVPLAEYQDNLQEMVKLLRNGPPKRRRSKRRRSKRKKKRTTPAIIIMTPPPVSEAKWAEECRVKYGATETNRTNENAQAYARAAVAAGEACGVHTLDLWSELMGQEDWPALLSDGLHLAPRGNKLVFELLSKTIAAHHPGLFNPKDWSTSLLPQDGPLWSDVKEPPHLTWPTVSRCSGSVREASLQ